MSGFKHHPKKTRGISLVETLIYVAIIAVMFTAIINMVLSFTKSYRQLATLRAVDESGLAGMERMTRDIRNGTSVDQANSAFNTSPGTLSIIQTINSISTTTKFYLQNNILKVDVNGSNVGPLTTSYASVSNLTFKYLTSSTTQAVKIDMTIQATSGPTTLTKQFHSTVILKGS